MRRSLGLCCLLATLVAACSGGQDRPDPSIYARPAVKPMRDDDGIDAPPPAACGDFCGETFLHEVVNPPNLYFLVDRSGSMADFVAGASLTKYDMARKVLGDVLTVIGHRVRYGATLFPASVDDCGPGFELAAPVLGGLPACDGTYDPHLLEFLRLFGGLSPGGSTPTSAALAELAPRLEDLSGDTYLVLLTDGAPNCNADAVCGIDECSLNLESATIGRQSCTSDYNCCDPANTGPLGPGYCVDTAATEAELSDLAEHGIPTYVVGMPGASTYAAVLDRLATAGGTARGDGLGYYAVGDQDELESALYAIGAGIAIRCSIDLDAPPDDKDKVNVYFDGVLVAADPDDGWSWDGDTRIRVHGDACRELKSGSVTDARAVFGCDTVVR